MNVFKRWFSASFRDRQAPRLLADMRCWRRCPASHPRPDFAFRADAEQDEQAFGDVSGLRRG